MEPGEEEAGLDPEPWLRGPLPDVNPLVAPVLFSFQQAREDLGRFVAGLRPDQIWNRSHGLEPVGFQLKHIAGSVDRLTIYLLGRGLDEKQMAALSKEMQPYGTGEQLLHEVEHALARAETIVRSMDPQTLAEPRVVGRKRLPTTVIGLLIHIAEHTQRHVGQAICAAKLASVQTLSC